MPYLTVTNLTPSLLVFQDPTGLLGLSWTVPGNTTVTNNITLEQLAAFEPQLDAEKGQQHITWFAFPAEFDGSVTFAMSGVDAFGRLRVANPETIFDSKMIVDMQTLLWDDAQTMDGGAGTSSAHNANQASVSLNVSNLTAGTRTRQTFRSFNYRPGKSQQILSTFVMGAPATGITRRVGYFDDDNGLYLEQTNAGVRFVRRTKTSGAVVNNVIEKADWNIDKFDGSGASAQTLDLAKAQILIMDFEWLGVGSVRFGFVINGQIYYAHKFNASNNLSLVYMSSPNLPLRYEITNDGTGPAASLVQICSTVTSEGGQNFVGLPFSADRGSTTLSTLNDAQIYPVAAIRKRAGYKHAVIIPTDITLLADSASSFRWCLLLNPVVAGTPFSFSSVNAASAVEADVARTSATTLTGGTQIASGYGSQGTPSSAGQLVAQAPSDFRLGTSIAGVNDVLVLGVTRLSTSAESYFGGISWREGR